MAKWEGMVSSTTTEASAEQIWPLFIDFFNLHKWFPNLRTCYGVEGVNGEVGGIRYCTGFSFPYEDDRGGFTKERLVAVNPNEMSMTYDIVDGNIGFDSYLSTVKIVPSGAKGCVVNWSFSVDPIEGITYESLVQQYQKGLDQTIKNMEDGILRNNAL